MRYNGKKQFLIGEIMKSLFLALAFIFSTSAFAVTMDDLAGVFEATSTDIPLRTIMDVTKTGENTGSINFAVKKSPYGKLSCRGNSSLNGNILRTESFCKSGLQYIHTADFSSVTNFDKFSIRVHNTLYGETITMHFIRKR